MKYIITLSIAFFSIISCQKKIQLENIKSSEPLKNYLNIKVDNDISLLIGELASVNDNINEDFQIINKKDSIFILKQFLESDNFDGKNLKIQSNHKLDINIKYNVGFNFLGDEKKANYLPINYIYTQKLEKESTLLAFEEIRNSKNFQIFTRSNINDIYSQSYDRFIKYYKSIPENELKSCCISDYENYSVVRKTDKNNLLHLDLEKQLITVPDYKSIIIDIKDIDTSKQYVIVFKKDILDSEYTSTNIQENQTLNFATNWEGIYWLYPYDIKSQNLGNTI